MKPCPDAPKVKGNRRSSVWESLRKNIEASAVRFYTPEDIDEINDVQSLINIQRFYRQYKHCTNEMEVLYVQLMRLRIWYRLMELRV